MELFRFWCCWFVVLYCAEVAATKEVDLHYLVVVDSAEPYQIKHRSPGSDYGITSGGVVSDLLREIFTGTDVVIKEVYLPVKRVAQYVTNPESPDWVSYGSPRWSSESAKQQTDFLSPALFTQRHSLVSLRKKGQRHQDYDDLRGKYLILITGYRYGFLDELVRDYGVEAYRTNSHANAVKMLAAGRGDYYLAHDMKARWTIRQLGVAEERFEFHEFRKNTSDAKVGITVKKNLSSDLRAHLERGLSQLHASGRLQEIIGRY